MKVGRTHCVICFSPYREEIEELRKRGITLNNITQKYMGLFKKSEINFYQSLQRHFANNHPPILKNDPLPIEERANYTFDEYADMLLQEGAKSISAFPNKVSHSHVIAAKRTLIEEAKAKNQIDATKVMFMKFFRGEAVEGEVVDDESTGEKTLPANTKG